MSIDADLSGLACLFQLLQQLVDLLQFLLDRDGFRYRHRRPSGEVVLGGQLIDLVLLAQAFDHFHQIASES